MSTKAIVHATPGEMQREGDSILSVIARAAADPTVDVGKLERMLVIQQTVMAEQRKAEFYAALSDLQAKIPQIERTGRIVMKGVLQSKFARIEDVDRAIRPLCAEHGFAFSFDSKPAPNGITFSCTLSHREGHAETKQLTLPVDTSGSKNGVQGVGSTTSYARRYLIGMHLHILTRDEDDDANGVGGVPITQPQADQLRSALAELGGSEARFLNWIAAPTFEEIPVANLDRARRFIDEKRKAKAGS